MAGSLRCLLCSHWILFQCLSPTCLQGALQTHLVFVYDSNMLLRVGWLTTKSRWVSKQRKLPVEMCTTVDSVSNLKKVSGTGNRSKSCVVHTRFSSIKPDWWGIPVYFRSAADLLALHKKSIDETKSRFHFHCEGLSRSAEAVFHFEAANGLRVYADSVQNNIYNIIYNKILLNNHFTWPKGAPGSSDFCSYQVIISWPNDKSWPQHVVHISKEKNWDSVRISLWFPVGGDRQWWTNKVITTLETSLRIMERGVEERTGQKTKPASELWMCELQQEKHQTLPH